MSAKKRATPKIDRTEEVTDPDLPAPKERLSTPEALLNIHNKLEANDEQGARNRGAVQELVDFVPPFDPGEMQRQGREDGFNVNYGLGASIKNEALGAFVDIFTSPSRLMNMKLNSSIKDIEKPIWEEIMGEELTIMIRSADTALPRFLSLSDIFTTHGVSIAYFDDTRNWRFQVTGLDEMKFPKDTESIGSTVPMMTCSRFHSLDYLYDKIANAPDGAEWHNGWHVQTVKDAIIATGKIGTSPGSNYRNYQQFVQDAKSNQLYVENVMPKAEMVYGWVREYSGKFSCYATFRTKLTSKKSYGRADAKNKTAMQFAYKEPGIYPSADQFFQIFPYSVGHKNQIYTQRGLGYFIYEAAQADNVIRNKMMENARMASSHVYSAETVDDAIAFEILDYGPVVVLPPGLVSRDQPAAMNMERNMIPVLQANEQMLERHSGGLAASNAFKEPRARENKLATAAFLEQTAKLNAFAISLFYNPWDKLMREIARRCFSVLQTDKIAQAEVKKMKEKCIERGVPESAFNEIDFDAITAVRTLGNGSRANRLMIFEAASQMFSSMDPEGQSNFAYDFLVEWFGAAQTERYKKRPSQRTEPVDSKIAELENYVLLDGGWVEPKSGEIVFVHLEEHLEELESGTELVKNGEMDYGEWASSRLALYRHVTATLEVATVHETLLPQLKEYRRRTQNIAEIIENGIKQLEARAKESGQQQGGEPNEEQMAEQQRKNEEHAIKVRQIFEEAEAKRKANEMVSKSSIAIKQQEAMAKIGRDNMSAAAELERKRALGL